MVRHIAQNRFYDQPEYCWTFAKHGGRMFMKQNHETKVHFTAYDSLIIL